MMKKTFTLIAIMLLLATQMFAQKLSYQAVIRNSNNELVYNATLTVEVSILGPSQNVLYSQTIQNVTSNQNGLITIQIGDDSPAWRAINWSDATIRSVIKDGTTTVATVNSAVSAVPLAIQTLNGSNGERVQADWEETDQNSPAFIQNKPTIPAAPDLSGYVTNEQLQNAGYLRYESQSLSDVAAYGNDAGSRQLKGLADPTDAQDAVTLSYLTTQLNALQQQLAQLGQVVAAQQAVIDSLTNGGSDTTGGPTTAQAPSVTSSSADLISENEATLFAYVSNPDNVTVTSKGFEYKVSGSANYTTAECYVNSQDDNGFGIYAPLTGLTAGTEYTYRAFVTTAEGTSYGSEGTFTTTTAVTPTTFTCGDNLIDGSNSYTTHQFGSQCWMTQNLRNASGSDRIYYPEVLTACPDGWHLPSQDEWLTLGNYLPSYSESFGKSYYMTTNATMPWQDGDGNAYTLMVRPAYVDNNNSVSIFNSGVACEFSDIVNGVCCLDDCGFAVRCVREETSGSDTTGGPTTAQAPSVTSSSADLITENEATLFAKVSNPDSVTVTSKGFEYKVSGSANYVTVNGYENYHNGSVFGIYAPLYNLTAGTEYTYRAFVTTAEGTIYGSEGTFTTTSTAPTASASVGDILLEDNSWVSPNDFDSTSMTAKGVIFHVDETGQHGWAVNLHNENEGYALAWSVYNQGGVAYNVDVEDLPNYTSYDAALSDTAGYQNTTAIRLAMDYQIFHVASQVNIMEGWYVPACGQVAVLMQNLTNVNSSLVTVNGTEIPTKWIWSSTEYGSDRAWGWNEEGMYNPLKSSGFRVRSIRSF